MFSVVTIEVRWFYRGEVPSSVAVRLKSLGGLSREDEPRTDHYMTIPRNTDLGIKWREGRIELKKRLADQGWVISDFATGKVELWKKWSFLIEKGDETRNYLLSDPENWVAVTKKRYLQLFTIDQNHQPIPHSGVFGEGETAMVELSEVVVNGDQWFTFGVECVVRDKATDFKTVNILKHFLNQFQEIKLDGNSSFGYPQWLAQLPGS